MTSVDVYIDAVRTVPAPPRKPNTQQGLRYHPVDGVSPLSFAASPCSCPSPNQMFPHTATFFADNLKPAKGLEALRWPHAHSLTRIPPSDPTPHYTTQRGSLT